MCGDKKSLSTIWMASVAIPSALDPISSGLGILCSRRGFVMSNGFFHTFCVFRLARATFRCLWQGCYPISSAVVARRQEVALTSSCVDVSARMDMFRDTDYRFEKSGSALMAAPIKARILPGKASPFFDRCGRNAAIT
jgi:hypothetical protein